MASGRLAATYISTQSTNTQIYQVPAGKISSFTINITNSDTNNATVRISLQAGTSVVNGEYIEYDAVVYPKDSYTRSGIVLDSGKYLYVNVTSASPTVHVTVWGFEEDLA